MTRHLASSWAKLQRAQEHFDVLQAECDRIMEAKGNAVEVGQYFEPETSSYLFVISKLPSLDHLALVVGDVLQNLRNALDHMVWQLVDEGTLAEPGERTQFPFAKPGADWASVRGDRLKGVSDSQAAIIERHQPKERGEWAESWSLGLLGTLSNEDKHHVLIPSLVFPVDLTFDRFISVGCNIEEIQPLLAQNRPLEFGTELVRVVVSELRPERNMEMQTTLTVRPLLRDTGLDLRDVLIGLRGMVVNVVTEVELSLGYPI